MTFKQAYIEAGRRAGKAEPDILAAADKADQRMEQEFGVVSGMGDAKIKPGEEEGVIEALKLLIELLTEKGVKDEIDRRIERVTQKMKKQVGYN
jgi:hypothetical protein